MMEPSFQTGVYALPDAARLLGVGTAKLARWVRGDSRTQVAPLIPAELRTDGAVFMSFVNLLEARFILRFTSLGVHPRSIRMMALEAARVLDSPHPFATKAFFQTDGRSIYLAVECESKDPKLYDLRGVNWAMHQIIVDSLIEGVEFSTDGLAESWKPSPRRAPAVVVDPRWAFGQPVLEGAGVPTRALYEAFKTEDDYEVVANWFDLPEAQVREAVRFEVELDFARAA